VENRAATFVNRSLNASAADADDVADAAMMSVPGKTTEWPTTKAKFQQHDSVQVELTLRRSTTYVCYLLIKFIIRY